MATRLVCLLMAAFLACSCTRQDENPYRMELDGLLHENQQIKESLIVAEQSRNEALALASLLQSQNENLVAELHIHAARIEQLSEENGELQVRLGTITERERESNARLRQIEQQKEEAKRQEELKRQQALAAIASANRPISPAQPPFRVYDVVYVGNKKIDGVMKEVGRVSIRNYTDQPLNVIANYVYSTPVIVPPNSSKEGVYIYARKGKTGSVHAAGHSETITWD